jgi:hypothetical protein
MENHSPEAIELMETILTEIGKIDEMSKQILEKRRALSDLIARLKQEHPTFQGGLATKTGYKGVYYSLRSKKSPDKEGVLNYLCKSPIPFCGWLKKGKKETSHDDESDSEGPAHSE